MVLNPAIKPMLKPTCRAKTDPLDARLIADYKVPFQPWQPPDRASTAVDPTHRPT